MKFFALVCFLLLVPHLQHPTSILAFEHFTTPAPIRLSATIGQPKLSLYGYSCANCPVLLQGQAVFEETTTGNDGYFEFNKIFLPFDSKGLELCLISIDSRQATTFPTCLPTLPAEPYHSQIGPVLLPPTINLSQGSFAPNQQVQAFGQAIPNSVVNIYLANTLRGERLSLIKTALAYNLPHYQASANSEGHFEFNLPVSYSKWRVFATSQFEQSPSPKSNTLTFTVLSPLGWLWAMIKRIFLAIFSFGFPYLWLLIILAELVAIYLLLKKRKSSVYARR